MTNEPAREKFDYRPQIFEAEGVESAKNIILTPEQGTSTEERWEKETPFLVQQIGHYLKPDQDTLILDFGCGIGRIARDLIETFDCCILGVDISLSMRQLAPGYVRSERFAICSPETLDLMVEKGLSVDHVISVWVLQHCLEPMGDIFRIKSALKQKGFFYVVNNIRRALPSKRGWIDDGINIKDLLHRQFNEVLHSSIPEDVTIPKISQNTFINVLQKI